MVARIPVPSCAALVTAGHSAGRHPTRVDPGARSVLEQNARTRLRLAPLSGIKRRSDNAAHVDLRPKRDLFSRRRIRERVRGILRVAALIGGDLFGAGLALAVTLALLAEPNAGLPRWTQLMPMVALLIMGTMAALGTYGPAHARRDYHRAGFVGGSIVMLAMMVLGTFYAAFRLPLAVCIVFGAAWGMASVGVRRLYDRAVQAMYRAGYGRRRTLIIGDHDSAWRIVEDLLLSAEQFTHVVGHLSPDPARDATALGGLEQLGKVIEEQDVWAVIVSGSLDIERFRDVLKQCLLHGTSLSVVPEILSEFPCEVSSEKLLGWPLIKLEVSRLHFVQVALKRTTDIVLSLAGMLLLLPVFAAVAVAVKLDSDGPVLFRQKRLGVGGRPFTIYKFRSMHIDAEEKLRSDPSLYAAYVANDYKLPPLRDPRVTSVGAFLRRTSLDELPQLFNVLKGQMSLVGPRPIVPDEIEKYGNEASVFLAVKPGVTGHWQTNGRSHVGYPERANLDIEYIENWSLTKDLEILLKTVPHLLRGDGAH